MASGKTISTERALKYVLELREQYDGPDREAYIGELDRFMAGIRERYGAEMGVEEAYGSLKDLEQRFGRQ